MSGEKRRMEMEWRYTLPIRVLDSDGGEKEAFGKRAEGLVFHPAVLGKRSKFFECLDEKSSDSDAKQELELVIPGGMTKFSIFVEYLYSGTLFDPLNVESAVLLFYLAYKYNVAGLMELCRAWWTTHCFTPPLHPQPHPQPQPDAKAGGRRWRRVNNELVRFLGEVHKRAEVEAVFEHVTQVDNQLRTQLRVETENDANRHDSVKPILETAWFHLALQIWAEAHHTRKRRPLISHGAPSEKSLLKSRTLETLLEQILAILPPKQAPRILQTIKLVETHKSYKPPPPPPPPPVPVIIHPLAQIAAPPPVGAAAPMVAVAVPLAPALVGGVYDMGRLAPMSRAARAFVSNCHIGLDVGKRLYPICQLASLTQSAAAHALIRLATRAVVVKSSIDSAAGLDHPGGLHLAGLDELPPSDEELEKIYVFLGPRLRISFALDLVRQFTPKGDIVMAALASVVEKNSTEKTEKSSNEKVGGEFGTEIVRRCGVRGKIAVLGASTAANLLLNGVGGISIDAMAEFQDYLTKKGTKLYTENILVLFLIAGLECAFYRTNTADGTTLPSNLESQNNEKSGKVYQQVCTSLFRFNSNNMTALNVLCRHVKFSRFRTHDDTWDILHHTRQHILENEKHDEKNLTAIDNALAQHLNLSIQSLNKWLPTQQSTAVSIPNAQTNPGIGLSSAGVGWGTSREWMFRILSSESREQSLRSGGGAGGMGDGRDGEDEWFVGKVIDVSDIEFWRGKWCPAEVLACRTETDHSHTIYIKYVGWSPYYNRWINTRSEATRIAPLGQHSSETALYTPERPPPSPQPVIPPPPPPPPQPQPPTAPPILDPIIDPDDSDDDEE